MVEIATVRIFFGIVWTWWDASARDIFAEGGHFKLIATLHTITDAKGDANRGWF